MLKLKYQVIETLQNETILLQNNELKSEMHSKRVNSMLRVKLHPYCLFEINNRWGRIANLNY